MANSLLQVHWDHVGEPGDFARSTFVIGNGSLGLLRGDAATLRGGHSFFEKDLLDPSRTVELHQPYMTIPGSFKARAGPSADFAQPWAPLAHLPATLDVFQDGSLYVVDAPGHLPGHINLLARTDKVDSSGHNKWMYLAGDACHDRRILSGEREIGEWRDVHAAVCCIHADRGQAEKTIQRIRALEEQGVEVILAHDAEWANNPSNQTRFFGPS